MKILKALIPLFIIILIRLELTDFSFFLESPVRYSSVVNFFLVGLTIYVTAILYLRNNFVKVVGLLILLPIFAGANIFFPFIFGIDASTSIMDIVAAINSYVTLDKIFMFGILLLTLYEAIKSRRFVPITLIIVAIGMYYYATYMYDYMYETNPLKDVFYTLRHSQMTSFKRAIVAVVVLYVPYYFIFQSMVLSKEK